MRRLFCFALLLSPALAAAHDCRYTAERNLDIDAAGLHSVAFELGSSDLIVEGVPGLKQVEVRGRACASEESWLADLEVGQRRAGDRVTIKPTDREHNQWFGSSYAYIDLRVRVPASLAAVVDTSSGDAEISNVASLEIEASSGDVEASHIAGPMIVKVSSGDVRAEDVGSVDVRGTGSGDVTLRDVHGAVGVAHAGSGDLAFTRVGSVDVGGVGSGDVRIDDASGDVVIGSIGSGDVSVDDVGGDFSVRSKGSGDVHHRNVRGKVSVPREDD